MADAKREKVKAQEKEAKAAKRATRKETRKQVWQAFNMQRKQDKWLIPLMLLAFLGLGLVGFLLGLIFHAQWFGLIIGLMFGAMLAMYIFPKRMENSFYERTKDEPGAAAWVVENLKDGPGMQWRTKTAVAANAHMDVVHRVVGAPGIILVGEGAPHRLKPLMEQQKKRLNRIAKQYPVYEFIVGEGEGLVPVKKLQREIMKLPRNYKKNAVPAMAARVESMDSQFGPGAGLPKGPLPKGANKMSGMNRRARRHANRSK
ncbi:DUF4191 domain-containing protein [Corynebacterium pyruviciproducens]